MSEIKRSPFFVCVGEKEYTAFDEEHTLSDFIRYLLTQVDREEILYLAAHVDAELVA